VTLGAFAAESDVADLLRETEERHPGVSVGSYPFFKDGRYGANFVVRCDDEAMAAACADELSSKLADAGIDAVRGGI
jgi:molybdopterin-biosynthesis enzyme MoeA-like protein